MRDHEDVLEDVTLRPIGVIHSPYEKPEETPIQPIYAQGTRGYAEILPEYEDGLRDLGGFSHIYLIYTFHKVGSTRLVVKPFLEDSPHGVFATRAPCRPNPIGFSVVRLVGVEGRVLHLEDVDVLDGTPLLDIKPYIPRFDYREDVRCGWQERVDEATAQVRGRRQSPGGDA
jgi:tRNA-Thr(GGU) m(6)t(6)A37 methyltransferase TsaA